MTIAPMPSFAESYPYHVSQGVKLNPISTIEPQFIHPSIEGDERDPALSEERAESALSRASKPVGKSGKRARGHVLKGYVRKLSTDFSETSALFVGLRKPGTSSGRIVILTTDEATQQSKSADGAKSAAKQVYGIARYFPVRQYEQKVSYGGNPAGSSSRFLGAISRPWEDATAGDPTSALSLGRCRRNSLADRPRVD